MTFIIVFLVLTNIMMGTGVYLSTARALSLLEKLEEIEESLEKCYLSLKISHDVLEEKTKIEVFSDEPIVKEVVSEMLTAKDAIQEVIDRLQEYSSNEPEVTTDEEKEVS